MRIGLAAASEANTAGGMMRVLGLALTILGTLVAAGGIVVYFRDNAGVGIAGMTAGTCFLGIGVMVYLTDFILRLMRNGAKLIVGFEFLKLKLTIHGEMGRSEDSGPAARKAEQRVKGWMADST